MSGRLGQFLIGCLCVTLLVSAATVDAKLSIAAMDGDKAAVQALLKQNVDVNAAQGDGMTALHWAAYRDDLEMAQLLLKAGASVKARTRLGDLTPLYMASKNGNAAIIDVLLKAGADTTAVTTTGTTPLMMAAASGSADAVKVLLDHGADANAKDLNQGQTALMFAAALDRVEVIKVLAARGADPNAVSLVPTPFKRDTPARGQGARGQANAQAQNTPQPTENADNAPPAPAANRGAAAGAAGARGAGGRADRTANLALGGMTSLQFAARDGQMGAVQALVAAGADVNLATASDKMTTLTIAILNGQFDIAKFLLDHGADPKPASAAGITALFALVDAQWPAMVWYPPPNVEQEKTSYLDLMKTILDRGADPNAKMGPKMWLRGFHGDWVDPAGATAFWRAAQANDVPAMKVLLAGGANPTIPTTHGCSPLQVAAGFGLEPQVSTFVPGARLAAVKFLVEQAGGDVNAKDDKGYTPLHGAALTGDTALIQYLVDRGADVKARANQFFGRGDGAAEEAAPGAGDTVTDMANGPRERNLVYPDAIALLVKLGSVNSDNCRSSVCIIKAKQDKKPGGQH